MRIRSFGALDTLAAQDDELVKEQPADNGRKKNGNQRAACGRQRKKEFDYEMRETE
ncbi:MAG: hypothetical protein K5753_06130 [Clostridia bacterium]|nr:hypothetical protein [Clostridia bacterium]